MGVAILTVDGRGIFLAWGLSGYDTKAAAVYLASIKNALLNSPYANYAELVAWSYKSRQYVVGYSFDVIARWSS